MSWLGKRSGRPQPFAPLPLLLFCSGEGCLQAKGEMRKGAGRGAECRQSTGSLPAQLRPALTASEAAKASGEGSAMRDGGALPLCALPGVRTAGGPRGVLPPDALSGVLAPVAGRARGAPGRLCMGDMAGTRA